MTVADGRFGPGQQQSNCQSGGGAWSQLTETLTAEFNQRELTLYKGM